ncbi:polysaccharide biosynthesis/export family protein [Acidithiobacillus thiooxidans]|uniref:polysaccharide biosynthesis/export family protein n=1 Tax=Acidithiobacillus thiooxidans TaxID=930 RepID=UPI002856CE15|nr:polysaccharide biosynthesis/export family protein [Acidithiobacillus thiooxidans]MDR7925532.1 polysaccharide biosynthesis/export family protein [Acidithiobacillus thiooxidans]
MISKLRALVILGGVPILLAGCASISSSNSGVFVKRLPSPVVAAKPDTLPANTVHKMLHPNITYHLGAGDVVSVSVYMHPNLSAAGVTNGSGIPGALVTNQGNIQLPVLGLVHVAGMTTAQLRDKLTELYGKFVVNPDVTVQLQLAHSIRYYLLGEFTSPGLKYSDRNLSLLDAMALGGTVNFSDADLRGAYVVQDGQKIPVNFHQLIKDGELDQNIPLESGDTVVIPSVATMRAFIFGAVTKPGPVPFIDGRLGLLQALTAAGMDTTSLTNAQLSDIRIIRSEGAGGELITVNAQAILQGRAAPFYLKSGDVVFVPQTAVSSWNQVIQQLLPSLQAISGVLNPFVSIKYLSQ